MTSSPTLPDPYEAVMVQVKQSKVEGANEGIFARRNTEKAINFNKNDLQHLAQNLLKHAIFTALGSGIDVTVC